jgi:hypothetical protein
MTRLRKLISGHQFFWQESGGYIGGWTLRHIAYCPIAYLKFMYYAAKGTMTKEQAEQQIAEELTFTIIADDELRAKRIAIYRFRRSVHGRSQSRTVGHD